jgi:hypothetical protein
MEAKMVSNKREAESVFDATDNYRECLMIGSEFMCDFHLKTDNDSYNSESIFQFPGLSSNIDQQYN